MQRDITIVKITMNNKFRIYQAFARLVFVVLAGALLVACNTNQNSATGVALGLAKSADALFLSIDNASHESFDIPADLVNGPRSVSRSIFIKVQDRHGKTLTRCSIVEIEPQRMHNMTISPGDKKIVDIPLRVLALSYCAESMRVSAIYGSVSADDRLVPVAMSNEVVVEFRSKE